MLGNELIHLDYYYDDELSFEDNEQLHATMNWSNSLKRSYGSAWRHIVCEDDCPEDSPGKKHVVEWDGEEEARIYWYEPHELCSTDYDIPKPTRPIEFWDHETMRLTVLRTCRQVYVEANSILWATNTFSFRDAVPFKRFMMTRTIHQKRLIRNVRLEVGLISLGMVTPWNSALNKAMVRSLSGLRSIRVQFVFNMKEDIYQHGKTGIVEKSKLFEGLRQLSSLPLTNAEVVVRIWDHNFNNGFWTESSRQEVAEGLKKMLLAPKGLEVSPKAKEQEQ